MRSQSAIATTAAESRFRIARPNSLKRSSLIVALDDAGLERLRAMSDQPWAGARFRSVKSADADAVRLIAIEDGAESDLAEELSRADVVMMVASQGSDAAAAEHVGSAAFARRIMTAGFVENVTEDHDGLHRTLRGMRPYVISLFVGFDEDALADILTAIRA